MENLDNFALPKIEKNPFETQFKNFLSLLATIKTEETESGEAYASLKNISDAYKQAFGEQALAPTTIYYRIKKFLEEGTQSGDLFKDEKMSPDDAFATGSYMLNIKNTELLKKIFLPQVSDDEFDAVKDYVREMHANSELRENLGLDEK